MPLFLRAAPWILLFFAGASLYSFFNVVICRSQAGRSFISGRSRCESCGHALGPLDLVPLLSWLLLRGHCRYCGTRLSPRYAVTEALGGMLALACAAIFGFTADALFTYLLLCVLSVCFLFEYDTGGFPAWLPAFAAVPALALAFAVPGTGIRGRLAGAAICLLPPALFRLLRKEAVSLPALVLAFTCGFALGLFCGLAAVLFSAAAAGIFHLMGQVRLLHFLPCWCCGTSAALLLCNAFV